MLDWSKINNDKDFQNLANQLFAIECNFPGGFISSSPYIGADGGWDGYYEGFYPKEGVRGIFSIQAKSTTKSLKDAYVFLKSEILNKELKNAKKNKVDHLRIVTNAELRVQQVKDLNELNNGEVKTLRMWHRAELERRIELQPYIKYLFFRTAQLRAFIPSVEYFNQESYLNNIPIELIPRFTEYLDKLLGFLNSEQKIMGIYAPASYGKSQLLKNAVEFLQKGEISYQIWFYQQYRSMELAVVYCIIKMPNIAA